MRAHASEGYYGRGCLLSIAGPRERGCGVMVVVVILIGSFAEFSVRIGDWKSDCICVCVCLSD